MPHIRPPRPSWFRRLHRWLGVGITAVVATTTPAETSSPPQPSVVRLYPLEPAPLLPPGFTTLPPSVTGITFTNHLEEERSLTNQIFLNGSGVALGDVNADGRPDLYLCGLDAPNELYLNRGDWRFERQRDAAGAACANQASTGAAFVDLDGDRDLDLLVNGIAQGTRLFLNDGQGRFTEATDAWGLRSTAGATSLAVADVNGDGWLDLYVVRYRNDTLRDMPGIAFTAGVTNGVRHLLTVNGQPANAPPWQGRFDLEPGGGILENGEPDAFFLNTGQGRLEYRPWGATSPFFDPDGKPFPAPYDWGLSARFHDLTGDGAPELYVCNDFQSPDRIWINDGQGRFTPIPSTAIRQTSLFSMGVDMADFNRDGLPDLFVADMLSPDHRLRQVQVMDAQAFAQSRTHTGPRPQSPRNTLFLQRSDQSFAEIAQLAGIDASDWSWCPVALDVDLDGFEDLLVTTGHWRDAQHADVARELDAETERRRLSPREQLKLRRRFPRLNTPNVAFRNQGDMTFSDTSTNWGFDSRRISQGIALADLDADGDLDVVMNCLNDGPLVLRNNTPEPRLAVRLRGLAPNTAAIGARILVRAPHLPDQTHETTAGGRYLSSDDPAWTFAAGHATNVLSVEVRWRDGTTTRVAEVAANHQLEITQAPPPANATTPAPIPPDPAPEIRENPPHFEDLSHLLGHLHADAVYDDFAAQPLLPHRLSHAGPGVAWFDFNGDGWDDLLIATGQGGRLAVFRNNTQAGFVPQRARLLETPAPHDQLGILGWRESATQLSLLLSHDGTSAPPDGAPPLRAISLVSGAIQDDLLPSPGSGGPLAMADLDADGDLDLFVGGRSLPGRFPHAAPSFLLRNQNGRLTPIPEAQPALTNLGPVNGAVFSDLDSDGRPELILACEWGPVRIFRLTQPTPVPWDPLLKGDLPPACQTSTPTQLSALTGWWNSVAAGDFNNDGRMDLIVGNWGRNTSRQRFLDHPLFLRFGPPDPGTPVPLLESHLDPRTGSEVALRDRPTLGAVFPALLNRFPTFTRFASATLGDLLDAIDPLPGLRSAATLDSMLLLQTQDAFEAHPLPLPAQIAPVFGIAVGDFDGDGNTDAILAQNAYGMPPSESRLDAGTSVWLRGNGEGALQPVSPTESGLRILGDARGAAVADFDQDGRLDLVVTQNRGPTRLFRNAGAQPGLRVLLNGPPENPAAIGAVVRIQHANGTLGPAQELHLGGGYLSQDAPTPILGLPTAPVAVQVRWPDGQRDVIPIPKDAKEFKLDYSARPRPR